jgi:iron complex outermembrane receptor protein
MIGVAMLPCTVAAADNPALLSATELKTLSLEQLLDVQVTSVSRHPERLLGTPSAIQVIRAEDIARSPALTLPEVLRLAPNLQVAQKNPHDWGISARGFNAALGNKLLVMIDGRTVYTPLFSGVFWDVQDTLLEDIERIEVVSGPGATLWGANAVNGVINVISKNAKDTQGLYVEGGGGNELRNFGAVRYGATLAPNVYFRVYGKTFDQDNAVLPSGAAAHDSRTMQRGGFRLDAELENGATATVQGDLYHGFDRVVTGGTQAVSGGNLLGRWSRNWSADEDMSIQVYYDRTNLADPITNQFGTVRYLRDALDTYDLDFQHRLPLGWRNDVSWGLGYRFTRDRVQNASNTAFLPPVVDHQLFSAFAQDAITLVPDVVLTVGTKLEHNDYTGFEVEPSVKLAWRYTATQSLWAAVSRAVRMPSRFDRDVFQPQPPPVVVSGNKEFKSETLTAYEVGYKAQLTDALSTSVSAYYNTYDHLRSFGPAPAGSGAVAMIRNGLQADTYGVEANAQFRVSSAWKVRAGYNYLNEHLQVEPGYTDFWGGRNEVSDPKHQVTIGSSWDLPGRVTLDADWRWVDSLPTTGGSVPAYHEADLRLGWKPTDRLELAIIGQNLLHAHHPEFGIATPRREEIQRSIYGRVSLRF